MRRGFAAAAGRTAQFLHERQAAFGVLLWERQ